MANLYPSSHLPSREGTQQIWRKADAICFDVDSTLVTIEGLDAILAWLDRFFPFFFAMAENPKEKRKKAVWPCETTWMRWLSTVVWARR